jgi:hypothetical protein
MVKLKFLNEPGQTIAQSSPAMASAWFSFILHSNIPDALNLKKPQSLLFTTLHPDLMTAVPSSVSTLSSPFIYLTSSHHANQRPSIGEIIPNLPIRPTCLPSCFRFSS